MVAAVAPVRPDPRLIGASDAAAILGLSDYRGPIDVYLRVVENIDSPMSEAARWGLRLEEPIREAFEERTGLRLVKADPLKHPHGREWQRVSPDYYVEGAPEVVEVKTAGWRQLPRWGDGEDEIPEEYLVQVQLQLEATGFGLAHVPVLLAGQELRTCYRVRYDPELAEIVLAACERFWREHVVPRNPPAWRDSDAVRAFLRDRYPRESYGLRPATPEETALVQRLAERKAAAEKAKAEAEDLRAELIAAIADAEGLDLGELGRVTYRAAKDSRVTDWKAVARELCSRLQLLGEDPQDTFERFTTEAPGSRRLLLKLREDT